MKERTTHSSVSSIGAQSREATERDGSGTTSRGKLNRIVLSKEGEESSLGSDVRDDYDVYEVLPHRAGSCRGTARRLPGL